MSDNERIAGAIAAAVLLGEADHGRQSIAEAPAGGWTAICMCGWESELSVIYSLPQTWHDHHRHIEIAHIARAEAYRSMPCEVAGLNNPHLECLRVVAEMPDEQLCTRCRLLAETLEETR